LTAALYAVEHTPLDAPLCLLSTNNVLTDLIFKRAPMWETRGWIDIPLAAHLRPLLNHLRQRCAVTTFGKVTGEDTWQVLERARQEASTSPPQTFLVSRAPTRELDPRFELTGARLDCLTQALAYSGIMERKQTASRRATTANLEMVRRHLPADTPIPNELIWVSTRHRDFTRPFAVFLWKVMHGGLKCGPYWSKIPDYEYRAQCGHCGALETIQHILFECQAIGQSLVWSKVRTVWEKKIPALPWPDLSMAWVLSLGLTKWETEAERGRPGATRLWRILVSEAVHLIWKLRCERVIGHAGEDRWEHRTAGVSNKLQYVLNGRLALDIESTRRKYANSVSKRDLIHATWNGVLWDEPALPDDWM
ncbi:uncharacterized protein B0H18DRAFT_857907, partial [Fomitopsis serialis]|uniref:uncharacterized protein n=1 Tax=Fomitopsis serialis TaxID=139415 RepID=UPI0020075939